MITSRKRLGRSLKVASREVVKRTWILLVRQGREKESVLARRVTMMEVHHSQERRRILVKLSVSHVIRMDIMHLSFQRRRRRVMERGRK
jgi:hypothetical protein